MILSDQNIKDYVQSGELTILPFDENQVEPATYDMRVGRFGITTSSKKKTNIEDTGYILLEPGDFGAIEIYEEIKLSNSIAARFGLRSKYARKGLMATTGTQIDPGYHGRLIIGITNLTPRAISLPFKDDFVSVEFHKLEKPSIKPYSGPYQSKLGIGPEEMEFISESDGMAFSEIMTTLQSLSSNVGNLSTDVGKMTSQVGNFKTIVMILIAALTLVVTVFTIVIAVKG